MSKSVDKKRKERLTGIFRNGTCVRMKIGLLYTRRNILEL